jgi:hypothetical protein
MRITDLYREAAQRGIVNYPDGNALARASRAYRKNLAEPGDCAGDEKLLAGLAIAEAEIGIRPGWLPECQRIGVAIAEIA